MRLAFIVNSQALHALDICSLRQRGLPVLAFDDPRWETLFPVAGDITEMLDALAALPQIISDERFTRTLTYLMAMVWHDNDTCPAALAIAPHLAAMARAGSVERRAACIQCIALFEVARRRAVAGGFAPSVPPDVEAEYAEALAQVPDLLPGCFGEPWNFEIAAKLAGALLIAKGHPKEGHEIILLRSAAERLRPAAHPPHDGIPW